MDLLPCPLTKITSSYKQSYLWIEQNHFYVQEEIADYTAFYCAICREEIGGAYFEQIDDWGWGIVPET